MWQDVAAASLGPTLATVVGIWLNGRRVGDVKAEVQGVAVTINGQHTELKSDLNAANAKIDALHEARLADAQNGT